MTEPSNTQPNHTVIVGGGVAGLEALLALRALLGDRVELTLVSQDDWLIDRPVTVGEPFGLRSAARYPLTEIAADAGAEFVHAAATAADPARHRIATADGHDLSYDTLILAPGARTQPPFTDAITFGLAGSTATVKEMLGRVRNGDAWSVAFVAPSATGWLLPLYELALMTAGEFARSKSDGVELHLFSPEKRPLELFGEQPSAGVSRLLAAAGIEFTGGAEARVEGGQVTIPRSGRSLDADYVVTLPVLSGPRITGIPSSPPHDFIPVDEYGRVEGLSDVYAAGDAVDFPVKQGGLAAQQADAVAEHIAAGYGAEVDPTPFAPVLRGMLFTGDEPLYMRSDVPGSDPDIPGAWYPLWWPPTKVAGRYLAPYLFERGEEEGLGGPPMGFADVDIPLSEITLPA